MFVEEIWKFMSLNRRRRYKKRVPKVDELDFYVAMEFPKDPYFKLGKSRKIFALFDFLNKS